MIRPHLFARSVPVARRNLFAERGRLAISVAGVAFAVLLIQLVVSLYRGWSGVGDIITELPGDAWVVQAGTSDPFHSTSILPSSDGTAIAAVPGVAGVTELYSRLMTFEHNGSEQRLYVMALGPQAGAPRDGSDWRFYPPEGEIYLDQALARRVGARVGDELRLGEASLRVGRTFSGGNVIIGQFAFISAADARRAFAVEGVVNYFLVTLEDGVTADAARGRITAAAPGSAVLTGEEFAGTLRSEINDTILPIVGVIAVIGFVVGVAVIGLTTYTATIEKSRDYGVMKALGASALSLYRIVISQGMLVALIGFALGLSAVAAFSRLIERAVPEFVTTLLWYDALGVFAAALAMAVVASYLPMRRINRVDPAMVFRA